MQTLKMKKNGRLEKVGYQQKKEGKALTLAVGLEEQEGEEEGEDRWGRDPPFAQDSRDKRVLEYDAPGVLKMSPWNLVKNIHNNTEKAWQKTTLRTVDDRLVAEAVGYTGSAAQSTTMSQPLP